MKKRIKKIFIFAILSLLLNMVFIAPSSMAVDEKVFDDYKECVIVPGDDDGKIITIIEESFSVEDGDKSDGFESRKCFRHSYQFDNGLVLAKLSDKESPCSESLTDSAAANKKEVYACYEVQVLLSSGGTAMIFGYIGMIYRWGASMAGIVAVLVLVISGIQISVSGGDSEAISKSKARIIQSLSGIAVLFLSGIILYTINPTFFTIK
jgi:hypothetical protein